VEVYIICYLYTKRHGGHDKLAILWRIEQQNRVQDRVMDGVIRCDAVRWMHKNEIVSDCKASKRKRGTLADKQERRATVI
jgi:hypothetical protein